MIKFQLNERKKIMEMFDIKFDSSFVGQNDKRIEEFKKYLEQLTVAKDTVVTITRPDTTQTTIKRP